MSVYELAVDERREIDIRLRGLEREGDGNATDWPSGPRTGGCGGGGGCLRWRSSPVATS